MRGLVALVAIALTSTVSSAAEPSLAAVPPVAKAAPTILTEHGHRRVDDYYWLRDKNNPAVIAYLNAENQYAASRLGPLERQIAELQSELLDRVDGMDAGPLFSDNRYIYRRRLSKGASHPLIVRHRAIPGAMEQIVLDVEQLAAGHRYYDLADYVISPDGNSVAYAVDLTGARAHRLFVRNISTGETLDTGIRNAASELVFSADSKWLFYIRTEAEAVRSHQLWLHEIGTPVAQDRLVYEERDPTFELHVSHSKSGKFILLTISQQQSTEVRYLRADRPLDALQVMEPRRHGVIYDGDHVGKTFYIRSNLGAPDFRLLRAPEHAPQATNWTEVIGETAGRLISEFELFDSFVALVEESNAIQTVRVFRFADRQFVSVPVPNDIGVTEIAFARNRANRNAASTVLRLRFSGPLHPQTTYDFNTLSGELVVHKRSLASSWFNPQAYEVNRIAVTAPDGESVPVTVMYRKDMRRAGGNPTLITGYGAYGVSTTPGFPDHWISLIDRGFVYVQAHVRGGQEKGARWYDHGRVLHKENTFSDFIAATEALIAQGYADPRQIFARGASAGGLLVAVAANRRPELYAGIIAEVPFVDVVTTMSDPTIPLTTLEYQEWGNPALKEHYRAMLSYSPYDNVMAKAYPPMLVTAALHDSQVGFQEPAKWVAKLRATKTDSNELLFVTTMDAGHSGGSGRFGANEDNARVFAWLIGQASKLD